MRKSAVCSTRCDNVFFLRVRAFPVSDEGDGGYVNMYDLPCFLYVGPWTGSEKMVSTSVLALQIIR